MSEAYKGPELLDLAATAARGGSGAILSCESDDLDLNLVRFAAGAGVASHVNREVDVLLIGIAGSGTVTVDDETFDLTAGKAILIPKGSARSSQSPHAGEFVYLTVHRRRRGLLPGPRPSHTDAM